jgi:alpha-1,3-rhamnosyl/mannosyltransferase
VRYLRYVPEPDLAGLTAGATAFVYPSLYEGFGFPIAQAMAAGVPVLTSNVSSMPEVTGAAAVLVDPHSPGEISAGLEKLLTSVTLRERLAVEGRERAGLFRWEECARQSMAFFERVMGHI